MGSVHTGRAAARARAAPATVRRRYYAKSRVGPSFHIALSRGGGGKFIASAQPTSHGTSTPGALVATYCVAAKAKLEWQSPRQSSRLPCALCSDAALRFLLCCFWFSWVVIKIYPLARAYPAICRRSSSGHGTAATI